MAPGMLPRPLRLLAAFAVCAAALGFAVRAQAGPVLQIDMVAAEDAIFVYEDLSPWYALGDVITVTRGGHVVGRMRVEAIGRYMTRLSLFDRVPGKLPRPGDQLVGQELPPKGPPVFTGTRTGYEIGMAVGNDVFVYENLSAYYPPGSEFRIVEGSVTIGMARLFTFTGHTTLFKADLPPHLGVRPGMRLYPTEEPAPIHPLLGPEQDFIGRGQIFDDELGLGPRGELVAPPHEPLKAFPGITKEEAGGMPSPDAKPAAPGAKPGAKPGKAASADCPARVDSIAGTVEVQLDGDKKWAAATLDDCLYGHDSVRTGADSGVSLALADGSLVKFSAESQGKLSGVRRKDDEDREVDGVEMDTGELWAEVAPAEGTFDVITPTGVVDVRGTEFSVRIAKTDDGKPTLQVFTLDGTVALKEKGGKKEVVLGKGKTARVLEGALSDVLDFDIGEFRSYLNSWKDLLTPGGVRDFIKAKAFDAVMGKLNDKLNEALPGAGKILPGGGKPKLGF